MLLEFLQAYLRGAAPSIKIEDVDRLRGQAAALECRIERGGIVADGLEVVHGRPLVAPNQGLRRRRLYRVQAESRPQGDVSGGSTRRPRCLPAPPLLRPPSGVARASSRRSGHTRWRS